jgi:hypothetical protein
MKENEARYLDIERNSISTPNHKSRSKVKIWNPKFLASFLFRLPEFRCTSDILVLLETIGSLQNPDSLIRLLLRFLISLLELILNKET